MVKLYLEKRFILGLYAYLRQIELSVDRALHDSYAKLVRYFENKVSPISVLNYLKSQSKIRIIEKPSNNAICVGLFEKMVIRVLRMIGAKPYLTDKDVIYIHSTLETFSNSLNYEQLADKKELIALRMRLNTCCDRLALILSPREIKRAQYVEHFNQNDILDCHPLEVIVGGVWPATGSPTQSRHRRYPVSLPST